MNDPLVSVVIACFDGAEQLEGCIRSVLDQNTNCEIIVVDDGSTDGSAELGRALLNSSPANMFVVSQQNRGPAAARNVGLQLARGKYLCFLDVDDRYAPGFFASTVPILEKDPAVVAVSCQIDLVGVHRCVESWQREAIEQTQPCNILMRTEVVRQIGGFPEQPAFRGLAAGEDGVFRTEVRRQGKVAKIDKPLYRYHVRPGGHFDFFLDRAGLENGKVQFRTLTKEESDGSLKAAVRDYRDSVQDRVLSRTLETLRTSVAASFEFQRLAQRLEAVEGYLHPAEGFTLYSLARRWPVQGTTVEIGSFKGRSTCWLAAGCRDSRSAKVVAIDHFRGSPEHRRNGSHVDADLVRDGSTLPTFRRNLEAQKLADWVTVRVGSSTEASKGWKGPIRLLFIDGEHSSEAVRQDFDSWSPFVVPRGLVVFHDVGVFPAVTQLYAELCSRGSGWKELARFHTLGILQRLGKESSQAAKLEAEATQLREVLRRHPEQENALMRLAQVLEGQKQWDEAIATYRQLLQAHPDHADGHNFLGILLAGRCLQFDEAMEHFRTFLKLQPNRASGYHNMGVASADQDKLVDAIAFFDDAIRIDPEYAEAHKGKSMAQLKLGQFTEGWNEYEWRWRCKDLPPLRSPRPLWDGSPLQGQTILLHSEQGMGDTIQFVRYASLVKEQGGRVILTCPAPLIPLLRTCPGIDRLLSRKTSLPPHDVHMPLLSLPRVLRTELTNVPSEVPYLHPDPARVQHWRNELANVEGLKVGIVWQGNPKHLNDANRSIALSQFQTLAEVPGVQLFSLQFGKGVEQLKQLDGRFAVTDLMKRFDGAFAETAAVMKSLDLIICVDTSTAHLAGALGIPVWVALSFAADWRWLQQREDSPWYPTMRLFRQQRAKDWPEVFARIAAALHVEVQKPRSPIVAVAPVESTAIVEPADNEVYRYSDLPENEPAGSPPRESAALGRLAEDFTLAQAAAPVSPQIASVLKLMQAQKHAQAEQALRQLLADDPADADAWFHLAQTQQAQNRLPDAVSSFRRVLELRADHAEAHAGLGILLCRLGQRQPGEGHLREAIRLQPKLARAHNNLGVVLAETGKRAEALACWQETIKLDPKYPEGHFNVAVGLAENKQPDEAAHHYERALQLRPNYAEAYSNLGLLRIDQGRPAEAIVLLEHAVRLKPDFVDAHNNLGLALADLGRGEEALACYLCRAEL